MAPESNRRWRRPARGRCHFRGRGRAIPQRAPPEGELQLEATGDLPTAPHIVPLTRM